MNVPYHVLKAIQEHFDLEAEDIEALTSGSVLLGRDILDLEKTPNGWKVERYYGPYLQEVFTFNTKGGDK